MGAKMKLFFIVQVLFYIDVVYSSSPRIDPLVRIEQGLVRGHLADDGMYSSFLGIPYAEVNPNNPFGSSEPHPGFGDEIFDAYDGSIACPQGEIDESISTPLHQSLDCLRLNIYVPYIATSRNPLPVFVWIHGGRFSFDQASMFNPKHFMDKGIVVVTINYRLGPYGFMCLDSPLVPGNQGLKDQHEALRWVRKNIAAFGGNPYEVTIGGQSAGSCSALLHLFSPKDKLYKGIIAQSGTPLSYGMFIEADTKAAIKLAEQLGLNTTDTDTALRFLAQASPEQVIDAVYDLNLVLRPCKEKSFSGVENFVETYPYYLSSPKKIRNTAVLIGHTTVEEVTNMPYYGEDYFKSDPFYERINEVFDLNYEQLSEAASIVKHFYIGDETVSRNVTSDLGVYESDFVFNHPVQRIISLLLKENASPVYQYVFSYLGDSNYTETGHNAELPYLFNYDGEPNSNEDNALMVERLTTAWANFVKYGNPTPAVTDLLPVVWDPVSGKRRPYMLLDKEMQIRSRVYHDRMAFWDLFYEKYGNNERMSRKCTIMKQRRL